MKKIFGLSFLIIGLLIGTATEIKAAANSTLTLDDTTGGSAFGVLDVVSLDGVATIDSDGNMMIRGGMRLDASGTENTTAENLIVDGAIGIGGTPSNVFLLQKASTTASSSGRVPAGTAPTTPNEGDYWNDSTQMANIDFIDGIKQHRAGCIFTQTASVTVANTTAEVTLVGSGVGTTTLPANFFLPTGKTIRITAKGYYSSAGTGGQTIDIRVRLGGISGTVFLDTGAQAAATANTNRLWQVDGVFTWRTVDNGTGSGYAQGKFVVSGSATVAAIWDMENTAVTGSINYSTTQQIVLSADWNSAAAGDTITCTNLMIEVLN